MSLKNTLQLIKNLSLIIFHFYKFQEIFFKIISKLTGLIK